MAKGSGTTQQAQPYTYNSNQPQSPGGQPYWAARGTTDYLNPVTTYPDMPDGYEDKPGGGLGGKFNRIEPTVSFNPRAPDNRQPQYSAPRYHQSPWQGGYQSSYFGRGGIYGSQQPSQQPDLSGLVSPLQSGKGPGSISRFNPVTTYPGYEDKPNWAAGTTGHSINF